ncbi:unnamed protein product [Phaedon cochleariae]|uniref:Uncharacterized protein n=1 Tax=Phaedon cochleariae TaxID=80249 RepID=A0A9N9S955_PHACE|nr:unnamed protein product [Phaedon cochleariae]
MILSINLGYFKEHLSFLRQLIPERPLLSTSQKLVIVSVSTSVVVFGVLSNYLRRKKRVIDPSKLKDTSQYRRAVFSTVSGKRSRTSGIRSPNGEVGSIASSGRRSAAYSDKFNKQGSIASGKGSIASGSLVSSGLPIPEGLNTSNLTPQQLGVMGRSVTSENVEKV